MSFSVHFPPLSRRQTGTKRLAYYFLAGFAAALGMTALSFFGLAYDVEATAYLFTFAIGVILYIVTLIAFSPIIGTLIIISLTLLLRFASDKKMEATGEPLIFGDISHTTHFSMALKYLSIYQIAFGVVVAIAVFLFIYNLRARSLNFQKLSRCVALSTVVILGVINIDTITTFAAEHAKKVGLIYHGWNWPLNLRTNGLWLHLIQTGERPLPSKITEQQRTEFQSLFHNAVPTAGSPTHFIAILCESCWYEEGVFDQEFKPVRDLAAVEFKGISPVFGGGTPNATFELITGLPVVNPTVSGVVYQEYRDYFTDLTSTLPSHLKLHGFQTESLHNYIQKFWFRDVVEPKLGFSVFHGIEQMIYTQKGGYPPDHILYDHALKRLEAVKDRKVFFHLATMYSHGPYVDSLGSEPASVYRDKLRVSVDDMKNFIVTVRQQFPESVILIYGDHKPAIPEARPSVTDSRHVIGKVPVILVDPVRERAEKLKIKINEKPFYCFSTAIADLYYDMALPVKKYTEQVCEEYNSQHYSALGRTVPSWVYSAALFDKIE